MTEGDEGRGPVEVAVLAELASMGAVAAGSARAAMAVDLARRQDGAHTATAAAQVAKELRATLADLAAEFPPAPAKDELERLRERRQRGAS